jgi:hypothetical protein
MRQGACVTLWQLAQGGLQCPPIRSTLHSVERHSWWTTFVL